MTDERALRTDPDELAEVIQRLEAYLQQREKIRDGGGIITATNGCELLLSDLKTLTREARHILQANPASPANDSPEVGGAMLDVAMEAYRQCRNSDEPSDARWVEEALMAARILVDPSLSKLNPRQVVPDDMLHGAMEAYRSARNMGTGSDRAGVRAALSAAQILTIEPHVPATPKKRTP